MGRFPQPANGHGSLRDTQILINNHPLLLTKAIKNKLELKSDDIEWVSPLKEDDYAEYRDNGFLKILGINSLKVPLSDFWPNRGPQWDALGKGSIDEVFLVEAKANIPEIVSPASGAKGRSLEMIRKSLAATKSYMQVKDQTDWSGKYYQFTNRMAHLYYLRVLNKIPAYLIFIYFIGDESVNGPKTGAEWMAALTVLKTYFGLGDHRLSPYIADVFIEVS
ncbi:MAG: hypothetical protein ACYSR7_03250 [Planctomycetota bacterium]|jgi:hypothetical protein